MVIPDNGTHCYIWGITKGYDGPIEFSGRIAYSMYQKGAAPGNQVGESRQSSKIFPLYFSSRTSALLLFRQPKGRRGKRLFKYYIHIRNIKFTYFSIKYNSCVERYDSKGRA